MALLSGLFQKKNNTGYTYAKMIDGSIPVYSQYGQDIYASDMVQMAIDCIATEISKLQPKHIRTDKNGMQHNPNGNLNRLFKFSPNPLMTTMDFLEKVIWLLYMNYNAFIYPEYDLIENNGVTKKEYKAFYPLDPKIVTFLQDDSGKLFIKMRFNNGSEFTLPYDSVIHLRKKFSVNEIMGGGNTGQPDNVALRKTLDINGTVIEGLSKAIKTSLSVRGILKMNTLMDKEKQDAEIKAFESAVDSSKRGILPMDMKGEYTDLKPDPKIIEKDTIEFLENKVLFWYGVPFKILAGTFNDEEYQAFYEKTLEPILISLSQSFSKTLFTTNELNFGNEIVFYNRDMMYLSTKSKLKVLEVMGQQGLLTDDQKLKIMGYPPLENGTGNRRTISLNYVSTEIADEYQLNRAKAPRIDTND